MEYNRELFKLSMDILLGKTTYKNMSSQDEHMLGLSAYAYYSEDEIKAYALRFLSSLLSQVIEMAHQHPEVDE